MIETTAIHVLLVDDQPDDREVIGKFLNLGLPADHVHYTASRLAEAHTQTDVVSVPDRAHASPGVPVEGVPFTNSAPSTSPCDPH